MDPTFPSVGAYLSREAAYAAVPRVIAAVAEASQGPKQLLVAALHGHSGNRLPSAYPQISGFEDFDACLRGCVLSSGRDMWYVRELYNITTEERLDQVAKWLEVVRDADGYEVRAFCAPGAISHLAPLVVGSADVFLGLEDARYFRVRRAVHIHDPDVTSLVTEYFDYLWNDRSAFALRSAVGENPLAIHALRERIRTAQGSGLHQDLKDAWDQVLAGHYQAGVASAFRQVEIAVRGAGGFGDSDLGVVLMRRAFHENDGVLTDLSVPVSERQALRDLFVGSIGWCRNPVSHREIPLGFEETEERIALASLLIRIVDSRARLRGARGG